MYHLPVHHYVADLFQQPDLVPYLQNNIGEFPEGHVRKSRGWRAKVTDNPKMNGDGRNQAFIFSTDGIPYFRDSGSRSGWPLVLRSANLPDGLWNELSYTHMVAFLASDYWDKHPSGELHRVLKLLSTYYRAQQ